DQTVKSWAFMNGRSDVTYKHPAMVHSVALSTDGRFLACGLKDQTIRVWDVATKQELTTLRGHSGPVFGLAFVGGSASLISGGNDRYVRVWNATANQQFQL